MTKVHIDTPFKHCNECEYMVVEYSVEYKILYCKYAHICRNAVTIAEKEKEK